MDKETRKQVLSRNIRYYMALKGVNRKQLCDATGIKYTSFQEWYAGRVYPKVFALEKLAEYFGCEPSDLTEDRTGKLIEGNNELSESKKALIQFAYTVPDEKAPMVHRMMQAILAEN